MPGWIEYCRVTRTCNLVVGIVLPTLRADGDNVVAVDADHERGLFWNSLETLWALVWPLSALASSTDQKIVIFNILLLNL